jgi:flagellar hook-associated protein 3 FlgL
MRVTSNSVSETLISNLQALSRRQVNLQGQIASGQRIAAPSDDPLAARQVLGLRDDSAALAQFQNNIGIHQEFATASQGVMTSLQKVLNRAQEIAVSVDDLDSKEDLQSYGTEIAELLKQAVQTANSQYRGEYLLGGTKGSQTPFTAVNDAEGRTASVSFNGNSSESTSEIAPGVLVSSRVPGANTSGAGERGLVADSRYGADLFAHLITLQNQLFSGDAAGVQSSTRGELEADENNLLYHVANNGALQSHLETALTMNKTDKLNTESAISGRTDVDMADALVRLNQQQTSYQAALQSAGSILNVSLLSYLR